MMELLNKGKKSFGGDGVFFSGDVAGLPKRDVAICAYI